VISIRRLPSLERFRWVLIVAGTIGAVALTAQLRLLHLTFEPLPYGTLTLFGSMLILTFAANALVRFRGTHDRISLILAFGFALAAMIETGGSFGIFSQLAVGSGNPLSVPLSWMVSRTVLGVLLLAALVVERHVPNSREPAKEMAAAFFVVAAAGYLISAAFLGSPWQLVSHPHWLLSRPLDLVPAGFFLAAGIGFRGRLRLSSSAFDKSLYWMAWLNVAAHLVASQSERELDAPCVFAQGLKVASYGVLLAGALIDNARLFDKVRRMAVTDSLTGLANYRTLIDAIETEMQRSERSGKPFAVLLLDLDRLKSVNDRYGHLVGTRAICRLAEVLRLHSRSTDTAARYGGDEFALVLPEASENAAARVAERICERLAAETELPQLSVSVGLAVYPADGDSMEKLLNSADRALYGMKNQERALHVISRTAAGV
jgi:diguanylate cyclase (GGDEF)-like protein